MEMWNFPFLNQNKLAMLRAPALSNEDALSSINKIWQFRPGSATSSVFQEKT